MSRRTDASRGVGYESDSPSTFGGSTVAPGRHWGYIERATSRYGNEETELVVYPPDSSDRERLWTATSHAVTPIASVVAIIIAVALIGAGVSPAYALLGVAVFVAMGAALFLLKTSRVRRRTQSVWVGTSVLHPDLTRSQARMHLEELAETMRVASIGRSNGRVSEEEYAHTWQGVYAEVTRLKRQP